MLWGVALGALSYSALVTLAIGSARSLTIGAGIKIGAIVGFHLWFTADITFYGISNVGNLRSTVVDPLSGGAAHPQDDDRLPRAGAADIHRAGRLARRHRGPGEPTLVMAGWNVRTETDASAGKEAVA